MKTRLLAAIALLLSCFGVASAHRLDEYLQATILSLEKDRIQASMRLIPGIAVASSVIASIDSNGDGVFSTGEQKAYADRVMSELSLTLDGERLTLSLISFDFPDAAQMKEGLGEIHIEFTAPVPNGGSHRKLILENHHQNQNSAYLVNSLVPRDHDIQIEAQRRNQQQSFYELDYVQAGVSAPLRPLTSRLRESMAVTGFARVFRLGMRHIAEGTDHLLFLLALLLPAPLLVSGLRWTGFAGLRRSLLGILKVVTAFTVGHSITLALAALGLVSVPSRPIEVLIAVSIFVSAMHALRPLFPGKEAAIAAFFGLIHGLAFASTLSDLGLTGWERAFGILAFNLGIETMQLIVVLVTMPSLLLLGRTPAYSFLRIGGALFASLASLGWIGERLFNLRDPFDFVVDSAAHHAVWIAAALFVFSLGCRLTYRIRPGDHHRETAILDRAKASPTELNHGVS